MLICKMICLTLRNTLMFKVSKAVLRIVWIVGLLRFGIKSGSRPLLCPGIKEYVMFNKVQ